MKKYLIPTIIVIAILASFFIGTRFTPYQEPAVIVVDEDTNTVTFSYNMNVTVGDKTQTVTVEGEVTASEGVDLTDVLPDVNLSINTEDSHDTAEYLLVDTEPQYYLTEETNEYYYVEDVPDVTKVLVIEDPKDPESTIEIPLPNLPVTLNETSWSPALQIAKEPVTVVVEQGNPENVTVTVTPENLTAIVPEDTEEIPEKYLYHPAANGGGGRWTK